jgi:hypothetical protein
MKSEEARGGRRVAEGSEGQGPHRTVEPMMMIMMKPTKQNENQACSAHESEE